MAVPTLTRNDEVTEQELIRLVRNGDLEFYGTLYERHVRAAYNLARQLTRSAAEADDLVSEAFDKVLGMFIAGKGPDSAFRAYLLTTLRHKAYDKTRKNSRVDLIERVAELVDRSPELTVPFIDIPELALESSLAAKAFAELPERWQKVLWYTEIEQMKPAEVAPILKLEPNAVSALAYRAREGLRQAYVYLQLDAESRELVDKSSKAVSQAMSDKWYKKHNLELSEVQGVIDAVTSKIPAQRR